MLRVPQRDEYGDADERPPDRGKASGPSAGRARVEGFELGRSLVDDNEIEHRRGRFSARFVSVPVMIRVVQ